MPLHVEGLTPNSSREAISGAISQSIKACMDEGGRTHDQCVGMVHGMARKATRNGSGSPGQRKIRAGLGD